MSLNSNMGLLDTPQVVKRVYDSTTDAIRIQLASGTTFDISLDGSTGDTVKIMANNTEATTATLTSASSGVVIASFDSSAIKSFQLYGEVISTAGASTAGNIIARIDVSPNGTSFFSTANTLTIPIASVTGTVVQGTILSSALSLNARVSLTTNALAAGDTVKFYLLGSGT